MDPNPGKSTESSASPINVINTVNVEIESEAVRPNPNPLVARTRWSIRRRHNILEAQSSGSLQEVVEETESGNPSLTKYEAYSIPSKFKAQSEIDNLASKYCIPPDQFICYLPSNADRTCNASKDLCVFKDALDAGLRFPLHPFIPDLLRSFCIHPAQIHPNGWKTIICFMVLCRRLGYEPKVKVFRRIFHIKNSTLSHPGWVIINHRSTGRENHIFNARSMPDSLPAWKDWFFYIQRVNGEWSDDFPLEWGTADDSSLRDWILTPEDEQIRIALEADHGQTHYVDLLNEKSLLDAGLSPVHGEGILLFNFHTSFVAPLTQD